MNIKKYLLLIPAILTLNVYAQITSSEQARVDDLFKQWNSDTSPGAAVGIIKDGEIIYTKFYGLSDLEHNIPITDSTIFYIGSVTKQFVGMCVLLLEEEGILNINDTIQKYLPDFPVYDTPITIKNLTHHTSGIRDNMALWKLSGRDYLNEIDPDQMYHMLKQQKELNFTPGDVRMYCNSGYFLLRMIIEKVTGEPLKEFARKNIFEPLGMHNTFFLDDNTRIIKNRAFSYTTEEGEFKNQIMRYNLQGSGGMYSNINDMYLWDQNFNHNKLGKGSLEMIEKMREKGVLNNGKAFYNTFGFWSDTYRGLKAEGHNGGLAGYRSAFYRFPDQNISVIVLGNVIPMEIDELTFSVAEIMLEKEMTPIATSNSNPKKKEVFVPENLEQYTGTFYCDEIEANYHITADDSTLYCSINYKEPFECSPVRHDTFAMFTGLELRYERDSLNHVSGLHVGGRRITNLRFKKM